MLKVLALVLLSMVLAVVTALVATVFFYAGWNWGVVPAVGFAKEVSLAQAFWLSLCVSAVGGAFKTSLTVNKE